MIDIDQEYEFDSSKEPIFEITTLESNKKIAIYYDGRVEGFGENIRVFNLIPAIDAANVARAKHDLILEMVKASAKIIVDNGGTPDRYLKDVDNCIVYGSEQTEGLNIVRGEFFSHSSVEEK